MKERDKILKGPFIICKREHFSFFEKMLLDNVCRRLSYRFKPYFKKEMTKVLFATVMIGSVY